MLVRLGLNAAVHAVGGLVLGGMTALAMAGLARQCLRGVTSCARCQCPACRSACHCPNCCRSRHEGSAARAPAEAATQGTKTGA